MRRKIRACATLLAALALVALVPACGGAGQPSGGGGGAAPNATAGGGTAAPGKVSIAGFAFSPANLEVKAGTEVTWTNDDSTQHTVTADDGAFSSPGIDPGKSYSFTFQKAGTYKYHCSIHPSMVGQVVVK
jgi:plastocyanin